MLVLGCEPLLPPYVAARQINRATGSYRRAARQPARAVRPIDRRRRACRPCRRRRRACRPCRRRRRACRPCRRARRPPHPAQTHTHWVRNLAVCHLAVTHPHSSLPLGLDLCVSTKTRDGPVPTNTDPGPGFRVVAGVAKTPTRSAPPGNDDDRPASAAPRTRPGGNRSRGTYPTPTLDNTDPRPGFRRVVGVVKPPTK